MPHTPRVCESSRRDEESSKNYESIPRDREIIQLIGIENSRKVFCRELMALLVLAAQAQPCISLAPTTRLLMPKAKLLEVSLESLSPLWRSPSGQTIR